MDTCPQSSAAADCSFQCCSVGTLGSELASELEKQLSVETSCVLPGVHVGLVFQFSCQLEFHVGYMLILDIGCLPAFGEG